MLGRGLMMLCVACAIPVPATAQGSQVEFTLGFVRAWAANRSGPPPPGLSWIPIRSRTGLALGIGWDQPVAGAVGVRPELRYAARGWAWATGADSSGRITTALNLATLGVPVRLRIPVGAWRVAFAVGPEFGITFHCTVSQSTGRSSCARSPYGTRITDLHQAVFAGSVAT